MKGGDFSENKKIILASIIIWVVSAVFGILTCGWLFNWVYAIPPIIWREPEAMMTAANLIGSYFVGLIVSIIFVSVYTIIYKGIPGEGVKKGMNYGLIIWLISAFSGVVSMPFYMIIAPTVIVYWITQILILNLINGAIVGKIYKEK